MTSEDIAHLRSMLVSSMKAALDHGQQFDAEGRIALAAKFGGRAGGLETAIELLDMVSKTQDGKAQDPRQEPVRKTAAPEVDVTPRHRLLLARHLLTESIVDLALHPRLLSASAQISHTLAELPRIRPTFRPIGSTRQPEAYPSGSLDLKELGAALPALLSDLQAQQYVD